MPATLNVPDALTLPDAQLEHWARVYLGMPQLRRRGVTFEEFLRATPQIREDAARLVQLAIRFRLDAVHRELESISRARARALFQGHSGDCSNGRFVEKLRHHRFPKSRRTLAVES